MRLQDWVQHAILDITANVAAVDSVIQQNIDVPRDVYETLADGFHRLNDTLQKIEAKHNYQRPEPTKTPPVSGQQQTNKGA